MRQAIFIAAALASGCVVTTTDNVGEADVYWSFWESADNGEFGGLTASATEVCAQAGVDAITIVLIDPGGQVATTASGSCITGNDVPGTTFSGLESGTWQFEIYGYRGTELVFKDVPANFNDNTFDVFRDNVATVDTYPGAIYHDLVLAFYVPGCLSTDSIEFDVRDFGTGGVVYSTYSGVNNPPITLGCFLSTPATRAVMFIPSLPPATYELVNLAQVDSAGVDVSYPACTSTWTQLDTEFKLLTVTIDSATPPGPVDYCL